MWWRGGSPRETGILLSEEGKQKLGDRKNSSAHKCQGDLCLTEELPREGGPTGQCFHFLPFDPLSFIPFLQGLDWAALAARKIPAPFRPQIRSELDVGNFAEEFTRLEPVYSPPGSPPPGDPRIFQVSESSWDHRCRGSGVLLPASAPADLWTLHSPVS